MNVNQIFYVSETWLTKDVLNQRIALPDFNVYRCDKGRGRGVRIYVTNTCTVTVISANIDRMEGIENL